MPQKTKNTKLKKAKRKAVGTSQIQYVLPIGNGWVVKNSAAAKFLIITDNKREAVSIARKVAKLRHIELIVYNKNGTIQEKVNYAV
jgi:hypothetical protein